MSINKPPLEIGRISPRVREKMVAELQQKGIKNPIILEALSTIKRHDFIPDGLHHKAYENITLPIGSEQTVSQPFTVALMSEALLGDRRRLNSVLEIGTGSGYQSAILSTFCDTVYSIERISSLIPKAKKSLESNEINNVFVKYGDGFDGWADKQPFDAIIITAAAKGVPTRLYKQLRTGGRIVVPVGESTKQQLISVTKTEEDFTVDFLTDTQFVPMLKGMA